MQAKFQTNLVDQLATVDIVRHENLSPKLWLATLDEVARLLLEHRVLVRDRDELVVAEALGVCNVREVRVAGLAEFTDDKRLVQLLRIIRINT